MHSDPTAYIIAAAVLGASIGFYAAALMASHTVRRANIEGWKEGVKFYEKRQLEAKETPRL